EGGTEDTPVVQGAAPQLYISGGASIRHLKADNRVYLGTDSLGSYATPEAWLSVETAETPEIRATWINLRSNMQDEDILAEGTPTLVSGWTHFYNDKAATVEGSDFHKTVLGYTPTSYSGNRIMYSEHVNNNTVIDLIDDDVTLIVKEMDGSDVFLGDSLNGTAPLLASNLGHQVGENEEKLMVVTYTGTTAEGKLTATDFYMPEGYSIRAAELHVAGTLMATASTEASTFALTRAVPGADTEFTNVQMKDAVITATGTSASSITADSISLGTGHVLSDATISTTDGLVAGNNTWLINITLADGDLTTYDDVVIYNMSMTGGKFMTEGDVSFNNVSLASMQAFGGSDGKAFTPAGGDKAEITFDGDLTKTGDDAFTLSLTNVTIDAAGHDFGKDAVVEVLKANDGSKISIDDLKSISFEVQPYTYASYDITEDGQLYLIGDKNEAKAKAELVNGSENRQKTMDAFEEALKSTPGGELAALRDAMGMVMKTSTEARREILDSISGASITALADSQRRGVQNVQNSLRNRIIQMGGNADWENAGIQAWAQADGSFSTTKSSEDAPGYDYTTWGATVGANIDLAETVTAGMSFSASYGEIKSDHADKATGDNNAYYVNLFARHQAGRWTQMLILTAGQNDMTLERTVGSYTAEGDTSGSSFSAYYEVGYTLGLNEEFTHILQPIVSARITSAKVDGYDEKGSIGNAALSYDGGSYTYGSVSAGLRYQGVLYESVFERNCVLEARAMVVSDFGDTTDTAK
ncbi:MAG: autotransporter outer membrane beta-barrel domain-containing protein, partial [Akkermansia sp.]|nr:autotransporter outer membrane beta-barrel domain-containing protein [Akkermansia sp.]